MANVSIVKLKVRRGTDIERKLVILDVGELGYVTDTDSRRIFIGDGSTYGGNPAGIKFYSGNFNPPAIALQTAQVGDIVFNPSNNLMYVLTGIDANYFPDYDNPSAYQFIGTRTDNSTIAYNGAGQITLSANGVQANHLSVSVVDSTKGLSKTSSGPIQVKYDNSTITVNGGGSLTIVPGGINISQINLSNQTINIQSLKLNTATLNTGPGSSGTIYVDPATGILKVSYP